MSPRHRQVERAASWTRTAYDGAHRDGNAKLILELAIANEHLQRALDILAEAAEKKTTPG